MLQIFRSITHISIDLNVSLNFLGAGLFQVGMKIAAANRGLGHRTRVRGGRTNEESFLSLANLQNLVLIEALNKNSSCNLCNIQRG